MQEINVIAFLTAIKKSQKMVRENPGTVATVKLSDFAVNKTNKTNKTNKKDGGKK